VLCYHKKVSDELKATVIDCNNYWQQFQVVIYSPTISCRVDFSPKDSNGNPFAYFDLVFARASTQTTVAREFWQQIGRIRSIGERKINVFIEKRKQKETESEHTIMKRIASDREMLQKLDPAISWKFGYDPLLQCHDWIADCPNYVHMWVRNKTEELQSRQNFRRVFVELGKESGWTIRTMESQDSGDVLEKENKECENAVGIADLEAIVEAPTITEEESVQLEKKIKNSKAEPEDLHTLLKYKYMNQLGLQKIDLDMVKRCKSGKVIRKLHCFSRVLLPLKMVLEMDLRKNQRNNDYMVHTRFYCKERTYLAALAAACGFDLATTVLDARKVTTDEIELGSEWAEKVHQEWCEIERTFGVSVKRDDDIIMKTEELIKMAQDVFAKAIGISLKSEEEIIPSAIDPIFNAKQTTLFWNENDIAEMLELLASRFGTTGDPSWKGHIDVLGLLSKYEPKFIYGDLTGKPSWVYYIPESSNVRPTDKSSLTDHIHYFWLKNQREYWGKTINCGKILEDYTQQMGGDVTNFANFFRVFDKVIPGLQKDTATRPAKRIFPPKPESEVYKETQVQVKVYNEEMQKYTQQQQEQQRTSDAMWAEANFKERKIDTQITVDSSIMDLVLALEELDPSLKEPVQEVPVVPSETLLHFGKPWEYAQKEEQRVQDENARIDASWHSFLNKVSEGTRTFSLPLSVGENDVQPALTLGAVHDPHKRVVVAKSKETLLACKRWWGEQQRYYERLMQLPQSMEMS
jgi:hypothetical protein